MDVNRYYLLSNSTKLKPKLWNQQYEYVVQKKVPS